MTELNFCAHRRDGLCSICSQLLQSGLLGQASQAQAAQQQRFKAGDRDIWAPNGKLTQEQADLCNAAQAQPTACAHGGRPGDFCHRCQAGFIAAALEGQRVLRERVAELEIAALASKAQLSTMLTRNVRQENELAVLRAAKDQLEAAVTEQSNARRDREADIARLYEIRADLEKRLERQIPASIREEERRERQAHAEERANKLADECGRLQSLSTHLTLENERMRRRLGE